MIIVGNVVAFIASLAMVYAGTLKKKKNILLAQCIELGLYTVSNIFLGGISGAIINFIGVIGNVLGYKDKLNVVSKIILSILSAALVIIFNNRGIIGYLPLVCMITYLWSIDIKNVITFKIFIMFIMILWLIYDYSVKSYVASIFDTFTIGATIISIIQLKRPKKGKKK